MKFTAKHFSLLTAIAILISLCNTSNAQTNSNTKTDKSGKSKSEKMVCYPVKPHHSHAKPVKKDDDEKEVNGTVLSHYHGVGEVGDDDNPKCDVAGRHDNCSKYGYGDRQGNCYGRDDCGRSDNCSKHDDCDRYDNCGRHNDCGRYDNCNYGVGTDAIYCYQCRAFHKSADYAYYNNRENCCELQRPRSYHHDHAVEACGDCEEYTPVYCHERADAPCNDCGENAPDLYNMDHEYDHGCNDYLVKYRGNKVKVKCTNCNAKWKYYYNDYHSNNHYVYDKNDKVIVSYQD